MPPTLYFLHLPKTGGQTIHHAVGALVGAANISPHRLPPPEGTPSFPPGYRFHSGHLNWTELDAPRDGRFLFTVLRDPRERIGSLYFYLRRKFIAQAEAQGEASLNPRQRATIGPPSGLFFASDPGLLAGVHADYRNVATGLLAFREMRRRPALQRVPADEALDRAVTGAAEFDAIYRFGAFEPLEDDMERLFGRRPEIVGKRQNEGPMGRSDSRWQALLDLLPPGAERDDMEAYVDQDIRLMARLRLRGDPPL